MGLIKADQLRNQAGTGNADLFKQWAATAWSNINCQTGAVRGSRNVSSIVDLGVGYFRHNFTNAMVSINGSTSGSGWDNGATVVFLPVEPATTVNSVSCVTRSVQPLDYDAAWTNMVHLGDLA